METFFLVCFAFGALFTAASVALGFAGSALHVGHVGHAGHLDGGGHAAGGHGDVGGGHAGHHGVHTDGDSGQQMLPLFNVSSLLAFLTWFGAAGFVLMRFATWPAVFAAVGGVAGGLVGAVLIALFLARVLAGEREMDPRDYRLEGTIARVTVTIPAGGTGEIVFSKAGSRRGEAARSLSGAPIPRGEDVVVIEYARGVAAVQPWDEFVARKRPEAVEQGTPPAGSGV